MSVGFFLLVDPNPPEDIRTLLEVIEELQGAAGRVANDKDWVAFFFQYTDEIKMVLAFVRGIQSAANSNLRK